MIMKKKYQEFKEAIGRRESNGRYNIENSLGFLGKYQFGMARLSELTFRNAPLTIRIAPGLDHSSFRWNNGFSKDLFLTSGIIQEAVADRHFKDLAMKCNSRFKEYLGKTINGTYIDLSGLVAGSHLGGIGNVDKFIHGVNNKDAYGTSVRDYIQSFAGYDMKELLR